MCLFWDLWLACSQVTRKAGIWDKPWVLRQERDGWQVMLAVYPVSLAEFWLSWHSFATMKARGCATPGTHHLRFWFFPWPKLLFSFYFRLQCTIVSWFSYRDGFLLDVSGFLRVQRAKTYKIIIIYDFILCLFCFCFCLTDHARVISAFFNYWITHILPEQKASE